MAGFERRGRATLKPKPWRHRRITGGTRERAWAEFVAWCRARRLQPLPAHPWTVAAYARWCESRNRGASLGDRLRAIARAHLLAGKPAPDRHPVVARTLLLIEARGRTRGLRAGLFSPADATGEPEAAADPGKAAAADRRSRRKRGSLRTSPRLVSRRPKRI